MLLKQKVAPAGIEPASQAPETCILSIVLRSQFFFQYPKNSKLLIGVNIALSIEGCKNSTCRENDRLHALTLSKTLT